MRLHAPLSEVMYPANPQSVRSVFSSSAFEQAGLPFTALSASKSVRLHVRYYECMTLYECMTRDECMHKRGHTLPYSYT